MKGVVATGHPLTSEAASEMLSLGGNAFDAGVAAGFASVVTEPALTSLGGGGFCLAHTVEQKKDILFDFFVNAPGISKKENIAAEMTPIEIKFPGCTQIFHTGYSSVAVPGTLKGLLHIHESLCTLPLKTILKPSLFYLEEGVEVNERHHIFLSLLKPIMTSADYGKKIFMVNNRYARRNDRLFNPELKNFFQELADAECDIYSGEIAGRLAKEMDEHKGLLSFQDLQAYKVIEREPLRIKYRNSEILTNPSPSLGGIKLALSLYLFEKINLSGLDRYSGEFLIALIDLMKEMYEFNPSKNGQHVTYPFADSVVSPLVNSYVDNIMSKTSISTQGTTHISIIDEHGNALSMTTSNGSGSGCYIPGTGIMLNNMMGEDELHPEGFFTTPQGHRVSSMMLPTMIIKNGKAECVMGSGGSKRIRTAILQTIINIIDFHLPLEKAVEIPRVHYEDGTVHFEPDVPEEVFETLQEYYKVRKWDEKDMYFGGVHCVDGNMNGWGDSRRGGNALKVS